jgi:DNA transformation protein
MGDMSDLSTLPNVGPVLAGELRRAEIETAERLRRVGAAAAWERVREVNPERDCAASLLALEGAVRGVRWMALEGTERERIAAFAESRRRAT